MKRTLIGFVVGFIVCAACTSVAFARRGFETIEVIYNNIQIMLRGERITPKNANGEEVEPFMLNSTVYLPVRAVSQALGLSVDWDSSSNTVILDDAEATASVTGGFMFSDKREYDYNQSNDLSRITCEITNISGRDYNAVVVRASIRDSKGNEIGSGIGTVQTIKDGQTMRLEILVMGRYDDNVDIVYEIQSKY